MLRTGIVVACISLWGCQSAPPPAPVAPPPAPMEDTAAAKAVPVVDTVPFADYRTTIIRQVMRLTKSREVPLQPADAVHSESEPPFSVEVLKKIGHADSFLVTTVGFGRVSLGKDANSRVEFLATVERYGPKIGAVLAALGKAMLERGAETPWKEYDLVQLPKAEHGLEYFDLRPAGEVEIAPDTRVVLLKVLPMSAEEYERAHRNASGEWDDPNAAARAVGRWRRLVD